MNKNNTKHQDNLDFIMQEIDNKPELAQLFKQIINFEKTHLTGVKIIFPEMDLKVNNKEFINEWMKNNPEKIDAIKEENKEWLQKDTKSKVFFNTLVREEYLRLV